MWHVADFGCIPSRVCEDDGLLPGGQWPWVSFVIVASLWAWDCVIGEDAFLQENHRFSGYLYQGYERNRTEIPVLKKLVWSNHVIFLGIGYASMVIVSLLNIYYIVILAWALFYLFQSFTVDLPWAKCGHYWNTNCCRDISQNKTLSSEMINSTSKPTAAYAWSTIASTTDAIPELDSECGGNYTTPETEFWESVLLCNSAWIIDVSAFPVNCDFFTALVNE